MPRIGVEAVADQWDTHDIQINVAFADGRVFNMLGPGVVHDPAGADSRPRILGAGPLSFEMVEPFGLWRMRIDGEAHATMSTRRSAVSFPAKATSCRSGPRSTSARAVPPWMNGALLPDAKWILENQEEGDLMGHPWRFEQLCRASGSCRSATSRSRSTAAPTGSVARASGGPRACGATRGRRRSFRAARASPTSRIRRARMASDAQRRPRLPRRRRAGAGAGCRPAMVVVAGGPRPGRVLQDRDSRRHHPRDRGHDRDLDFHGDAQRAGRRSPTPTGHLSLHVGR